MEHKAFIFDTEKFKQELLPIMFTLGSKKYDEVLQLFIISNMGKICSPYTGEFLDYNWENELENGELQEFLDFAITCYYNPIEDRGISYSWDVLLQILRRLPLKFESEYYVLGCPIKFKTFILDPGGMGMGFIQADDVSFICQELIDLREVFIENVSQCQEVLYDITFSELINAYDELILLYKDAAAINHGILMTF